MTDTQKALAVIRSFREREVSYEDEELAEAIVEELKRLTLSEAIIKNGEFSRKCDLGHSHVVYALTWRAEYVPTLRLLQRHRTLTTSQLGRINNTPTVRKCLSELVHFGLVQKVGTLAGERLYGLTPDGEAFVSGSKAACTRVWPKVKYLPPECTDSEPKRIHEVIAEHPGNDRAMHAEMAIAVGELV
ncbi:hypothetical protein [Blastopirellula marina]|uniref:Uncharacterized protein n=1 Tax=Blastopirellula marina TaxID=124 RepID=A0A2S8GSM3_9BACT|nr:hypothetical protein [Blastopirellula marina]PQO47417.1 hypothetical protein C5Y93_05065 [Blastopirellula marina]